MLGVALFNTKSPALVDIVLSVSTAIVILPTAKPPVKSVQLTLVPSVVNTLLACPL